MLRLLLKQLRSIAKNRNIYGYKSMPKGKLLRIINNNNKKKNRNSICKLKRGEITKSLYEPTRKSIFKSNGKKPKNVSTCHQKRNSLNQNKRNHNSL